MNVGITIDSVMDDWVDFINDISLEWLVENNVEVGDDLSWPLGTEAIRFDRLSFLVKGVNVTIPNTNQLSPRGVSLSVLMYGRLRDQLKTRLDNPAFMEYIRLKNL